MDSGKGSGTVDAAVRGPVAMFGIALVVALLSHLPALWGGFVYDDLDDVVDNPSAKVETFFDRLPDMTRPLLKASYALQDALHGPFAPAFHLVNLALHLLTAALVALLLHRAAILAGYGLRRSGWIGGLAASLWAVHPASADTVGQIAGRSAGLSTALVVLSLWFATRSRPRLFAAGFAAALAPLARETALIAPLLLLIWQVCLPQNDRLRRALPIWVGTLIAAVVLMNMPRHAALIAFSLEQRTPLDAVRGNVFAVTEMLRLWVNPWRIGALPVQPVSFGWADAPTLARIGGMALALGTAVSMRRRGPLWALAVLWVAVALLPSNSVIWRVNPVAMRPMYLAGIGLVLVLAIPLSRPQWGRAIAGVLVLWLGLLTWQREALLSDPVSYFANAAKRASGEAEPLVLLGLALANAGRTDEAVATLEQALQIDPADPGAINALRLLQEGSVYSPTTP